MFVVTAPTVRVGPPATCLPPSPGISLRTVTARCSPLVRYPPLGAAIRGEPSSVVDAHIRLFCRVGGLAKAPVMAAVQPVIKHERQGRGWQAGPVRGIVFGARPEIEQLAAAMGAGVVR